MIQINSVEYSKTPPLNTGESFIISVSLQEINAVWNDTKATTWSNLLASTWDRVKRKIFNT